MYKKGYLNKEVLGHLSYISRLMFDYMYCITYCC